MYLFPLDQSIIFLIPAMILAFYAQIKVSSTFKKYADVRNARNLTGADVAKRLLTLSGVDDVSIEQVQGHLTDHYDPRTKTLRLSESVFGSSSLSAVGVAAHETGHAVQHAHGYAALAVRNAIFPVVNISSNLAFPLILIGILFTSYLGPFSNTLISIGIAFFIVVIIFQVITLPVEFNASGRALKMLYENNILTDTEIAPARKVLNAAALTYVAALAVSLANLLRMLSLLNRRR